MGRVLKELQRSCQKEDGSDDPKKGTQLLEIYAVEIQMYTEQRNNKKLKQLYHKALAVRGGDDDHRAGPRGGAGAARGGAGVKAREGGLCAVFPPLRWTAAPSSPFSAAFSLYRPRVINN